MFKTHAMQLVPAWLICVSVCPAWADDAHLTLDSHPQSAASAASINASESANSVANSITGGTASAANAALSSPNSQPSRQSDSNASTVPPEAVALPSSTGADAIKIADAPATKAPPSDASRGKRLFSILAATMIGTPICAVRRSKWEDHYGTDGMVGDSSNKFATTVAGTFWLPMAIVTGCLEAPADAAVNAITYNARPFSKDQLSLGVLKQNR